MRWNYRNSSSKSLCGHITVCLWFDEKAKKLVIQVDWFCPHECPAVIVHQSSCMMMQMSSEKRLENVEIDTARVGHPNCAVRQPNLTFQLLPEVGTACRNNLCGYKYYWDQCQKVRTLSCLPRQKLNHGGNLFCRLPGSIVRGLSLRRTNSLS